MFFIIRMLIRKLLKNRDLKKGPVINLKSFFAVIRKIFRYLMMKEMPPKEVLYYSCLKASGHLAGIRFEDTETSNEYSLRLSERLPLYKNEIHSIVKIHNDYIYGGKKCGQGRDKEGRSLNKKINKPCKAAETGKKINISQIQ